MDETLLENEYGKYWLEEGILFCLFKSTHVDLHTATECVKARITASSGRPHLVCVDMQNVQEFSKEARDYSASSHARKYMKAGAIIVKNPLSGMIANFFLAINQPPVPAKMFTSKTKAIKWLKKFE